MQSDELYDVSIYVDLGFMYIAWPPSMRKIRDTLPAAQIPMSVRHFISCNLVIFNASICAFSCINFKVLCYSQHECKGNKEWIRVKSSSITFWIKLMFFPVLMTKVADEWTPSLPSHPFWRLHVHSTSIRFSEGHQGQTEGQLWPWPGKFLPWTGPTYIAIGSQWLLVPYY